MKLNFKKIASVLAGTVMMSSTLAFAAAANYPAPFVKSGNADVAVVYGSQPGAEFDLLAVADITQNLQAKLASQTAVAGSSSTSVSISGEAAPLFTGSTKIYVNDSLNVVKGTLTKTELPTVLKDGSFSGNVDATFTQVITLGSNPSVTYAKMPTSDDDPAFGLSLSTSTSNALYNESITFNKAVNLTHADSKGQELTLFGQKFTIGSATDSSNLVLLKSAQKISLSNEASTTKVEVAGKEYTIELVSAGDTSATVKVTDSSGNSDTKEINENGSKKVQGLTVAVTNSDENNLRYSASIIAGSEKITLTSGSAVAVGEEDTAIDGTLVTYTGGLDALTKITVSVAAPDSDHDAIVSGKSFVDPVFGSFKVDFPGLNIDGNSSAREEVSVKNNGDDRMEVSFTDHRSNTATVQFAKNLTTTMQLMVDDEGRNMTVAEGQQLRKNELVVVGNEDEGYVLKVTTINNQSTNYNNDKVELTDVMDSTQKYTATLTGEGVGTITIGGKVFTVNYWGTSTDDGNTVRLNYPDSSGAGSMIVYPTVQTSKGSKLMFYKPMVIDSSNWDGMGSDTTQVKIPNGDTYTDVSLVSAGTANGGLTIASTTVNATAGYGSVVATVGQLVYNFTYTSANTTTLYLMSPTGGIIVDPALVVIEQKDDNSRYEAAVITLEAGATSDDGIGVNSVAFTRQIGSSVTMPGDSKVSKKADLFGTVAITNTGDSDQAQATLSIPSEQLYAQFYGAANSAAIESSGIVSGGVVKELGNVVLTDAQVTQAASKNLIVVGGSCVNTVAAELLGGAGCGSSWETATGVGSGAFLVQTFERTGGKVATLVAGYDAADTRNAAKVLVSDVTLDLSAGKKYKSTSATTVQMVTTPSTTTA